MSSCVKHYNSHAVQVKASNAPDLPVEAILITHKDTTSPRPSVLIPHGGPHSCYPASYYSGYTFLLTLGFNLVLVNFRGSTGFGEDSIQSLPGHIGTNDALDCMACLQAAVDTGQCSKVFAATLVAHALVFLHSPCCCSSCSHMLSMPSQHTVFAEQSITAVNMRSTVKAAEQFLPSVCKVQINSSFHSFISCLFCVARIGRQRQGGHNGWVTWGLPDRQPSGSVPLSFQVWSSQEPRYGPGPHDPCLRHPRLDLCRGLWLQGKPKHYAGLLASLTSHA